MRVPSAKPTIYLIAGCNGAGKTTFAKETLPKEVKCLRFLNADDDYLPLATRWAIWDSRSLTVKRLAISTDRDIEFVRKLIGV